MPTFLICTVSRPTSARPMVANSTTSGVTWMSGRPTLMAVTVIGTSTWLGRASGSSLSTISVALMVPTTSGRTLTTSSSVWPGSTRSTTSTTISKFGSEAPASSSAVDRRARTSLSATLRRFGSKNAMGVSWATGMPVSTASSGLTISAGRRRSSSLSQSQPLTSPMRVAPKTKAKRSERMATP